METAVSVIPPSSRQMLEEVVVSSEGAGATVNCLCSMWSRVFSIALNLFSRLVVPRIPTCNWGPKGRMASNHHVQDGPSGKRGQSSSVSGIRPNTRCISVCCDDGTVSHHFLPFVLTCNHSFVFCWRFLINHKKIDEEWRISSMISSASRRKKQKRYNEFITIKFVDSLIVYLVMQF